MKIIIKFLILVLVTSSFSALGQRKPSQAELQDLTQRAMNQLRIFQNNTSAIAANENSYATKKAAIRTTLKNFSKEATIQEQGKNSSRPTLYTAEKYLNTLLERGAKSPTIIDFDIVNKLDVAGLEEVKNPDGTVTFKGKMTFKQYYCKLKDPSRLKEPNIKNNNLNCSYHDITEKEVGVEILRIKGRGGEIWVTLITYIHVIKVY